MKIEGRNEAERRMLDQIRATKEKAPLLAPIGHLIVFVSGLLFGINSWRTNQAHAGFWLFLAGFALASSLYFFLIAKERRTVRSILHKIESEKPTKDS